MRDALLSQSDVTVGNRREVYPARVAKVVGYVLTTSPPPLLAVIS